MQQGGQPQQQASPNDPMEQLVPAIKAAIEQGMPLAQLILTMAQNNIPMDVIQQGLVVAGIPEQEIMGAMNELQQQQQQAQQEAPVEGPIQPTEGEPAEGQPKMPPVDQVQEGQPSQTPMAQDGAEIQELDDEEMQSREEEPIEELVTDYGDGYHYKKITDPTTGDMTYFTKSAKGKKWRDLQESGNEIPLKAARAKVFGDQVDQWEGTEDKANWEHKKKMERLAEIEAYKARKAQKEQEARNASDLKDANNIVPSYADITKDGSGYYTKVIQYPKGDKKMLPGHIESVLMYRDPNDPKSKPRIIQQWMDNDGNLHDAIVNRWEDKGRGVHQFGYDSGGDDNAGVAGVDKDGKKIYQAHAGHFRSMADLQRVLDSDKYIRTADIQLDSKGLGNYLNSAAKESGIDYHFENNNCADGVCRAFGIDDKNVGNTAGTEGLATLVANFPALLPKGVSIKGGPGSLTDPQQVMDFILKNKNVTARTGTRKNRSQGVQDMARDGLRNLGKQNGWSPETVEALQSGASVLIDGITYIYRNGRLIKQTAEKALEHVKDFTQDNIVEGNYGLNEYIKDNSPFDFSVKGFKNIGNYWGFQEGGEPGRYGNILNQAQYGMGTDNYLNFNQKFGQDPSFRSNINSAYMPMNLGMKGSNVNLLATVGEGVGRLFGAKDKDGDGLADGAFRDLKAKRNRHKDTMDFMKGKTPKGMENMGDKLMMKYDPETGNYQTAYNDPRYQSNIKKKNWGNILKGKSIKTDELLNKPFDYEGEGFKSFNQLKGDMSKLSQEDKDQLQYVADQRSAFEADKKNMPKGMQFGMDERGAVGYYDKDATLPENSQENINKMMMQNYKKGGSFNNPGFKALPESVQQKIMTGIQKGQDGKEIMGEIMEAPEMNHVQGQEAIIKKYEDIIRRMRQQHAAEMQQLMMQMEQGQPERGVSIGDMMNEADTMTLPPMQMGGGFSLPFAQDGDEVSSAIFNTDEAKRQARLDIESPSMRQAMSDLMDNIKQSQLSTQGATAMDFDAANDPSNSSGSNVRGDVPLRRFLNRRTPEERALDRESRMVEREARRDERDSNKPYGRDRRPNHEFTKLGKFTHNIQPWNWSKDKQVRSNPTRFAGRGKKIRQDGGGMVDMSNFMPPQVTDHGMMDPRMMEMQYMNDTAQQMMDPQGQAEMMQQMMSPQQLMQMQQYLEQLLQEIQEASPKGRAYKKPSPHDMDTVELTTEQIAKIMAAGGSVKIV